MGRQGAVLRAEGSGKEWMLMLYNPALMKRTSWKDISYMVGYAKGAWMDRELVNVKR